MGGFPAGMQDQPLLVSSIIGENQPALEIWQLAAG